MFHSTKTAPRFPIFRRIWKPAMVTGAGGAAISIWWDEIVAFGDGVVGLIILPIMAGIVYLLDMFFFKSRMPEPKDWQEPGSSREKE
jgi:hypothetical protein